MVPPKVAVVYCIPVTDGSVTFGTLVVSTVVKFHAVAPLIHAKGLPALSINAQLSI